MARKKWTPANNITDTLLKFREKRKWQMALRRYVLEKNASEYYAPYFGIDIENYRKWIELQFDDSLNWQNFGSHWQIEHIVSVNYFDYSNEDDLILCWNFINTRVERLLSKNNNRIDIITAKPYFENLYNKTGLSVCSKMLIKLELLASLSVVFEPNLENFIVNNKIQLEIFPTLTRDEFSRVNHGTKISDIFLEREILKKFG